MVRTRTAILTVVGLSAVYPCLAATPVWRTIETGVDLAVVKARAASTVGDSQITVVRVDPRLWEPVLVGTSSTGEAAGKTARQWAEDHHLAIATNAGMFGTDHRAHVGFMKCHDHTNSASVNGYQSVAAFAPRHPGEHPPFRIFDLDAPGTSIDAVVRDYACAVQNLRLIKRPGSNRWSQQDMRWSEAALGQDGAGRILFIFSRSPFSMHDLNRELLAAGIGIVAAQHLEGGPEAQLYLEVGGETRELFGSYETSFREDEGNANPWPIPNVLGVKRRASSAE